MTSFIDPALPANCLVVCPSPKPERVADPILENLTLPFFPSLFTSSDFSASFNLLPPI